MGHWPRLDQDWTINHSVEGYACVIRKRDTAYGYIDEQARTDFLVKILAHRFGRFTEIRKGFTFSSLREARPRLVILTLYATLLVCAMVSGLLAFSSNKHPAPTFGCTQIPRSTDSYVWKPQ
jgi:hypothetical protein